MILAKDLKVGLATLVATVGLLGFGTASASVLLKEADEAGVQTPLYFAKEAYLGALGARGGLAVKASSTADMDGDVNVNNVDVLLELEESYYFRYDLDGPGCDAAAREMCPVFAAGFDSARPYIQGNYGDEGSTGFGERLTRAGGGEDDSYALYSLRLEGGATDGEGVLGSGGLIPAGNWSLELAIRDQAYIELPRSVATTGRVCYSITLSIWDDAGEASANSAAGFIYKVSTDYACLIDTVSVAYAPAAQATATIVSGFTRFLAPGADPNATMATLGTATVTVLASVEHPDADAVTPGAQAVTRQIMHPMFGRNIATSDVLEGVDFRFQSPGFAYSSPFGFGEFSLGAVAGARYVGDTAQRAADLGNRTNATGRSTRAATDNMRMSLSAPGAAPFRVNVGANTAANAALYEPTIGQGGYTVSWQIDRPGTQANPAGAAARPAGSIMRDGTTVRAGYLTTATDFENADVNDLVPNSGTFLGSYNQRLIITNHSARAIEWRLGSFVTEIGVTATPRADDRWEVENNVAIGTIGARRQIVVKMTDLLEIEGGSRAGGEISLSAAAGEISVVITQVTRPEGQTDTVQLWPLDGVPRGAATGRVLVY